MALITNFIRIERVKFESSVESNASNSTLLELNVFKSVSDTLRMARVNSYNVAYELRYEISFGAPIRGHHVYKEMWTPQIGETLYCKNDNRQEALQFDKHAVGVFKDDVLVGHVPIEVSRIISYFLQTNETNTVQVEVTGKRKRELGLIVPGKYHARTENERIAKTLGKELQMIKEKYTHFDWAYEKCEKYCKIPIKK